MSFTAPKILKNISDHNRIWTLKFGLSEETGQGIGIESDTNPGYTCCCHKQPARTAEGIKHGVSCPNVPIG